MNPTEPNPVQLLTYDSYPNIMGAPWYRDDNGDEHISVDVEKENIDVYKTLLDSRLLHRAHLIIFHSKYTNRNYILKNRQEIPSALIEALEMKYNIAQLMMYMFRYYEAHCK